MVRRVQTLAAAVLLIGLLSTTARAGQWSAWESIGNDLSVSYVQVSKDTWTWKFRNDGKTAVTYLTFTYTDKDGTHSDIFPGSLKAGAAFGGWAAFTASSRPTKIEVKEIKRK